MKELGKNENIIVLCGHYEGVDERVLEEYDVEEISIGDFCPDGRRAARRNPHRCRGAHAARRASEDVCFEEESHYDGLLEYPQYTRPSAWRGREVRRCF